MNPLQRRSPFRGIAVRCLTLVLAGASPALATEPAAAEQTPAGAGENAKPLAAGPTAGERQRSGGQMSTAATDPTPPEDTSPAAMAELERSKAELARAEADLARAKASLAARQRQDAILAAKARQNGATKADAAAAGVPVPVAPPGDAEAGTAPAKAAASTVSDEAKFFSSSAVQRANGWIRDIKSQTGKDLVIETYDAPPADMKPGDYESWITQRASALDVDGVLVLITRHPAHIHIQAGPKTRERIFTSANVKQLAEVLITAFKAKQFDDGLLNAVNDAHSAMLANGAMPNAPAPTVARTAQAPQAAGPRPAPPAVAATPTAPRAAAAPAAAAAQTGLRPLRKVGEEVEAKWHDIVWSYGVITKVEGEKYFIDHRGRNSDEWVERWQVRAIGSKTPDVEEAAVVAQRGPAQVEMAPPQGGEHINLMTIGTRPFNNRLVCDNYWFLPDGTVYFGVPPKGATFQALLKAEPANCGTYGIKGTQMTLARNGQKPRTVKYDAGFKIGEALLRKVVYFDAGQKLDGTWGRGNSTGGATSGVKFTAAAASSWTFHADGTFEGASVSSFSKGKSGLGASNATKGTYELTGAEVKLTYEDGTVKSFKIAGSDNKATPYVLCVDDGSYVRGQ